MGMTMTQKILAAHAGLDHANGTADFQTDGREGI